MSRWPGINEWVYAVKNFAAAKHFAIHAATGRVRPPPHALLHDIDLALDVAIAMRGGDFRDLLPQLVGIRRSLFADAPPFDPAPPLGDVMAAGVPARKAT